MIGDDIEVCVLTIATNQIRLGISAPKEVKILREELIKKEREDNGTQQEATTQ